MSDGQQDNRTVLPPAEAEGAGNFAAEPDIDPTTGPGDPDVGTKMETGTLNQPENPSPAGDEGNRTGGDPGERIVERRADGQEDLATMQQELREGEDASNPNL